MVGDRMSDVDAGQRSGCRSILVGQAESDVATVVPDFECLNLLEASDWILNHS
jgi:phosphoglycolate phosphatase-like HAD superfamily hydrolase